MIPATAYSQIADLNNVTTTTQTPVSTQCLDFNQDGICESIVLVNGTIIKNPDLPVTTSVINRNNTNSNSTTPIINTTATTVDEDSPCGGGPEYELEGKVFCTPEEYKAARQVWYEQEQEEKERECEQSQFCQNMREGRSVPWNEPWEESGGGDNDDDNDLPQEGGCQEEDDYCDRDENCQSSKVDCIDDRNFDEDDYNG